MPAHECLILPMSCQVSLYVNLDCFMSNYYISVCMPNALCHILYAECNGLYAKLHMLDCNMPNAMTIAMSFSMTTEQVGYLVIYISIIRLWLSILPLQRRNYYYITMASVYISALRYICLLAHQVIKWYLESQVFQYANISWQEQNFSMPTYHGKSKISVCQHIMARAKFQYAGISWHEQSFSMPTYHGKSKVSVCQHIMAWAKFQYADISWQEPNFSMPTYHGINLNPPITVYFGSPAYQGIYQ
jgi:hypothetical protein